jgi:DNA polymerase III subunit alpha
LISSCQHRATKTGKPFGSFMLEDYTDTFELVLFGEDYIKFKQFLTDGYFLQIRGSVSERFKQKDNWEFKITTMALLSELRDKMAKCLTIQLPLHELSDNFISKMDEIIQLNSTQNPNRNCQLRFNVLDYDDTVSLEMMAKNVRIFPSDEFLEHIKELNNITYKLN